MSERRLYLDTSALRQLGRRLTALNSFPTCKTSVVALIELLNGARLSDDEFARRRATIRCVLHSELNVDWRMLENKLFGAFREIEFHEDRTARLRSVLACVANSVDRSDFVQNQDQLLPYGIKFWESYDSKFGPEFIKAVVQGNQEIRQIFDVDKSGIEALEIGVNSSATLIEFCRALNRNGVVLNRSVTLDALAESAARLCGSSPTEGLLKRIYESYDGSIDVFLDAFSRFSIESAATASIPGRNDALDLAHFLYLGNGDTVVSNDGKLKALASNVGLDVLGSEDLL